MKKTEFIARLVDSLMGDEMNQESANRESAYVTGEYLANNPTWHVEDSSWKACKILDLIRRNNLFPKTICEVGCGAGEILCQLQANMDFECEFHGYEISPQAYELSKRRANPKLQFHLGDFLKEHHNYDIILLIDLIEHLEDYYGFLRGIRDRSKYKILHIPLALSVETILRKKRLPQSYRQYGHLHYFTKDTALIALNHAGYHIHDWFYTSGIADLPQTTWQGRLAQAIVRLGMSGNKDWTATFLRACSIMVLVSAY
jgi:hypothetical protein